MRRNLIFMVALVSSLWGPVSGQDEKPGDFEVLFRGTGDIVSYLYFDQSTKFLIDTELGASVETFRYKRFFFALDLFQETSMGRKPIFNDSRTDMLFDPNKGHWSFGGTGRFEFPAHFFEIQFHHDCFHGVDRFGYEPIPTVPNGRDSTKYWNALRFGFGNLEYLPKNRYHRPNPDGGGMVWGPNFDYFVLASFFAPRGYSWQKYHGYDFTLDTDMHIVVLRYRRLGINIDSENLWVIDNRHTLKHRHELRLNFTVHGDRGLLSAYLGWWPYDNQLIRNRDGMGVFGIHLGF